MARMVTRSRFSGAAILKVSAVTASFRWTLSRAAADDGVSGLAALGDGGEGLGDFPERVFAKMIVHGEIPF